MSRKFVVNVWGINGDAIGEGSARVLMDAWLSMCRSVNVLIVNTGKNGITVRHGDNGCLEMRIAIPRISNSKFARALSHRLFGYLAPSVLLNVDSFVFSIISLTMFRSAFAHANRIHTYNFWFAFLSIFFPGLRRKLVYTELGGEWALVATGRASRVIRLRYAYLGRWVLGHVRVIAQSETNKRDMVRCGVPSSNLVVVQHARTDPNLFRPTVPKLTDVFNVLYVGRIVPQKGLHILTEASNILVNRRGVRNVIFTVIGPAGGFGINGTTSYYRSVIQYIHEHSLSAHYRFMGYKPLNELIDAYSRANVYVLPSTQDASPSSVTEAQMCGTPVIGTRSGGMLEMIKDGVTGFLVPVEDPVTLAEKLELLYAHPEECNKMGANARKWAVSRFSTRTFASELMEALFDNQRGLDTL